MMGTLLRTVGLVMALAMAFPGYGQSRTVFAGIPSLKISEGGVERTPETTMTRTQAANLHCVISQIGEDYYWASRENKPMVRIDSGGAYITFLAVDGAGYVRIVKPELKKAAALASETEERFDYVEHLLSGLRSVTYYGTVRR
jgi:hypothetical protein